MSRQRNGSYKAKREKQKPISAGRRKFAKSSLYRKFVLAQLRKAHRETGVSFHKTMFITTRSVKKSLYMKDPNQLTKLNKQRGRLAEYETVHALRALGFDASRVTLSGSAALRGDVLIKLPDHHKMLIEVKFSSQHTKTKEKCLRLRSDWLQTINENVSVMEDYGVKLGLFVVRFVFSRLLFVVIEESHLRALEQLVQRNFSEYQCPARKASLVSLMKHHDTAGKSVLIRAISALKGAIYQHTVGERTYVLYTMLFDHLFGWLRDSYQSIGVWYDYDVPVRQRLREKKESASAPAGADYEE